ncbi:hypothetical protein GCM10023321_19230 [Pseudonocardia eucalypti]|uniref:Uncharacterized protein n=1 Tax=Pseudonocardia eucalypti TaxID=648755 RepID=A0ABP9PT08_9PSEU
MRQRGRRTRKRDEFRDNRFSGSGDLNRLPEPPGEIVCDSRESTRGVRRRPLSSQYRPAQLADHLLDGIQCGQRLDSLASGPGTVRALPAGPIVEPGRPPPAPRPMRQLQPAPRADHRALLIAQFVTIYVTHGWPGGQ